MEAGGLTISLLLMSKQRAQRGDLTCQDAIAKKVPKPTLFLFYDSSGIWHRKQVTFSELTFQTLQSNQVLSHAFFSSENCMKEAGKVYFLPFNK